MAKPTLTRKQKKAYAAAVDDEAKLLAALRGDPDAIQRAARQKVGAVIDNVAATMPTPQRGKITKFAKRGLRNP